MNSLSVLAVQQLAAHVAAWAEIPVSLTLQSPISYANGGGLNLTDRLASFASEVRSHEASLLRPLGISQAHVDDFMSRSDQYRLLFWQLPLAWVRADKYLANQVLGDLEALGTSLRALEKAAGSSEDQAPLTIGREVNYLRRLDPLIHSLELYHGRRPSYRPPVES
jgi:hypothetical protein